MSKQIIILFICGDCPIRSKSSQFLTTFFSPFYLILDFFSLIFRQCFHQQPLLLFSCSSSSSTENEWVGEIAPAQRAFSSFFSVGLFHTEAGVNRSRPAINLYVFLSSIWLPGRTSPPNELDFGGNLVKMMTLHSLTTMVGNAEQQQLFCCIFIFSKFVVFSFFLHLFSRIRSIHWWFLGVLVS